MVYICYNPLGKRKREGHMKKTELEELIEEISERNSSYMPLIKRKEDSNNKDSSNANDKDE